MLYRRGARSAAAPMMRILALTLAALAALPIASAGAAVSFQSHDGGDCEVDGNSQTFNYVDAWGSAGPGNSVHLYADTWCWSVTDPFSGQAYRFHSIWASGEACAVVTSCRTFAAQWWSMNDECNTFAESTTTGRMDFGCPAGGPPQAPALLP